MYIDKRIYVAGHLGLAGSAIVRRLRADGARRVVVRTRAELDLTDAERTREFFESERPEIVVLAAAKVGGILANASRPAEFIRDNLAIQTNVIHEAWRSGVERLLFLGSSCIYPRDCPQPIREDYLLTGPLEATNRAYALAKIAGIEMCWSYNRQYGTRFLTVMPTNLYGANDNYDLQGSHVMAALIRKFHEARERGDAEVTLWGSGRPRREFLYSDDLADACVFLLARPDDAFDGILAGDDRSPPAATPGAPRDALAPMINVGVCQDLSIAELADIVRDAVGYRGRVRWDADKPDGTPRKLLDVSRMSRLGWRAGTGLRQGIGLAYRDFLARRRESALESSGE